MLTGEAIHATTHCIAAKPKKNRRQPDKSRPKKASAV